MPDTSDVEILLVEDNQNDAELSLRALKKRNMANKVLHVKDGVEALDFIFRTGRYADEKGSLPKVIFLDLKLPKVDGLEVLRKIKANETTKSIPIVVLTSSKENKDTLESYKLGVNSYIVKPVDFDQLVDAVSNLGFYWLSLNHLPR
jgi:CheY-like chemotaxis protein